MLWGNKKTEAAGELTEQQKLWANLNVGDEKKTSKFQKVKILHFMANSSCFKNSIIVFIHQRNFQLMGASKFKDMVKDDAEAKQNADKLLNKQVVCGLLTGQVCTIKNFKNIAPKYSNFVYLAPGP